MVGVITSVLICGGLGLLLIQHLTTAAYHCAIGILPWLLCTLLKMLSELLNLGCFVEKSYPLQMNVNLVPCGFGGLLLIILVPLLMVEGALTALITANALRMGLFYYYSQKSLYLPYNFSYLYTAISAAVVATCFGQISE